MTTPDAKRVTWIDYYMSMAYLVSTRGTCNRKKVGAVLVKDNRIEASGYNGAPAGQPHCDDVGHLIKNIDGRDSCIRSLHAESNAIDSAGRNAEGALLYTTVIPCYECGKRIINANIGYVIYCEYYESRSTELVLDLLEGAGVIIRQWAGRVIDVASLPPVSNRLQDPKAHPETERDHHP